MSDATGDAATPAGERDLARLLAGVAAAHDATTTWTFCTVPPGADVPPSLDAIATVRETEGWSAIAPLERARTLGVRHEGAFARITLAVHSSLAAVGFLAAVAAALAARGIACNAVAGFHHDHLFVPRDRADDALAALARLAAGDR